MNTAPQKTAETLDFPWKHCLREAGAASSNLASPTNSPNNLQPRRTGAGWTNGSAGSIRAPAQMIKRYRGLAEMQGFSEFEGQKSATETLSIHILIPNNWSEK